MKTDHLMRFICFTCTGQLWGPNISCVLSVLDILNNCEGPNIWCVFIRFRYTGQLWGPNIWWDFFNVFDILDSCWNRPFDSLLFVLYILDNCGKPNICCVFICFRYTGQLWGPHLWWDLSVLDILDDCGERTSGAFYLFWIYWSIVGDRTFDGCYLF